MGDFALFKQIKSNLLSKNKIIGVEAQKALSKIITQYDIVNAYTEALGHTTFYIKESENEYQFYILLNKPPLGGKGGLQLRPLGRIKNGVWYIARSISDVYDRKKSEPNWDGDLVDQYSYSLSDFCMHHLTSLFNVSKLMLKLEIPWEKGSYIEFSCTPKKWITRSTSRRFSNDYETQSDLTMRQILKLYKKSYPMLTMLGYDL